MTPEEKSKRDSTISLVRKLSRMTMEAGASEAEAKMAASRMAKLIADYNIGQSELTIKADAEGCIFDEFTDASDRKTPWTATIRAICELFSCRYYYQTRLEDLFGIGVEVETFNVKVYGFQTDVAAAMGMFQIVHSAIGKESDAFFLSLKGGKKAKLTSRESFELGMAHRIAERIKELILAKTPPTTSTGRGLIVLKDQLVTQQFAQKLANMKIRLSNSPTIQIKDRGAFAAGHVKGGAVALSKDVGQTRQIGN